MSDSPITITQADDDDHGLILDKLSDRLATFRSLRHSDDESATESILHEFGASGKAELDIVTELSARKPLWLPARFEEAHHHVSSRPLHQTRSQRLA